MVSCGWVLGGKYCGGFEVVVVKFYLIRFVEGGYDWLKGYFGYWLRFCMIVKFIYDGVFV